MALVVVLLSLRVSFPETEARARDVPKAAGSASRSATLSRISRENIFSRSLAVFLSFKVSQFSFRSHRTEETLSPKRSVPRGAPYLTTENTSCNYAVLAQRAHTQSPKTNVLDFSLRCISFTLLDLTLDRQCERRRRGSTIQSFIVGVQVTGLERSFVRILF